MSRQKGGAAYPAAVVDTLVTEFPNLADPTTAAIVREAIARHISQPDPAFECIIDDPILANWRLRARREALARIHLVCYRLNPTSADYLRGLRINQALQRLPV